MGMVCPVSNVFCVNLSIFEEIKIKLLFESYCATIFCLEALTIEIIN